MSELGHEALGSAQAELLASLSTTYQEGCRQSFKPQSILQAHSVRVINMQTKFCYCPGVPGLASVCAQMAAKELELKYARESQASRTGNSPISPLHTIAIVLVNGVERICNRCSLVSGELISLRTRSATEAMTGRQTARTSIGQRIKMYRYRWVWWKSASCRLRVIQLLGPPAR